jgi:hypothetical protein
MEKPSAGERFYDTLVEKLNHSGYQISFLQGLADRSMALTIVEAAKLHLDYVEHSPVKMYAGYSLSFDGRIKECIALTIKEVVEKYLRSNYHKYYICHPLFVVFIISTPQIYISIILFLLVHPSNMPLSFWRN